MENLMTNMSLWGVVIVLINTLRISWEIQLPEHTNKISSSVHLLAEKAHIFIKTAYKPLTIFLLSAFTLFVCYRLTADKFITLWGSASLAGVMSIGISILLRPGVAMYTLGLYASENTNHRAFSSILKEKNITNGGALFICLVSLLIVFTNHYNSFAWDTFTVLAFIASFAIGASSLLLCMYIYENVHAGSSNHATAFSSAPEKILSNDRYDTLGGALVAAMLLGTTFTTNSAFKDYWLPSGGVLLPLLLTISGVCISAITSAVARIKAWKTPTAYLIEKMIAALLMIVTAFICIQHLLPYSWVLNGVEHTSLEVFYAAQTGIIGGLLTNKVIQVYRAVHKKYFNYINQKSFEINLLDKAFHFFINSLSTITPIFLIVFSILLSYYLIGLYGILIALVVMLANITTRLTVGR